MLLLGGGAKNRYTYRDWLNEAFASMGIAPVPREAFGPHTFITDWVDSDESHALLDYRRRDYAQYLREVRASLGPAVHLVDRVLLPEPEHRGDSAGLARFQHPGRGGRRCGPRPSRTVRPAARTTSGSNSSVTRCSADSTSSAARSASMGVDSPASTRTAIKR